MTYNWVKNSSQTRPRQSPRLNNLIFKYYNVQYFDYGVHNLQLHQTVTIVNRVRPAKGNLVTEKDKKATIVGFSPQRIQLKTENGILTTRKYKYVKVI